MTDHLHQEFVVSSIVHPVFRYSTLFPTPTQRFFIHLDGCIKKKLLVERNKAAPFWTFLRDSCLKIDIFSKTVFSEQHFFLWPEFCHIALLC
jgi:hypothetical protein